MSYIPVVLFTLFVFLLPTIGYGDNTADVKAIFQAKCASCHNPTPTGRIFDALDVKDMLAKNILQGGTNSKVWQRLTSTDPAIWMPLGKDPLPFEELQKVRQWQADGTPAFDTIVIPPPSTVLSDNDLAACIRTYGLTLNPVLARNLQPVQLSNLGVSVDQLQEAVVKLFNTVSIADVNAASRGTVIPCKNDPRAIVFLDLRALNQTRARIDQFIVDSGYPYFIDHTGIDGFEEAAADVIDILKIFGSRTVPWIRADFLVDRGAEDPFYSRFLFKDTRVNNLQDFLNFVGLDLERELLITNEARVAIFRHSGVTLHNRELQVYPLDLRIASGVTYRSQLWITFDFQDEEVGRQHNLFAEPFGPVYTFFEHGIAADLFKNKFFIQDASEVLFMTPGGLASALFAGPKLNNKVIAEALTEVAFHPANASSPILGTGHVGLDGKAGSILNGVSCFACHSGSAGGAMNSFADEGRAHVNLSTDFTNDQVNFFNRVAFKDQLEVDANLRLTNQAYQGAQKSLGAKKLAYPDFEEPIFVTSKAYEGDADVCQFGRELGFTCDDIKLALSHAPDLARKLGLSESLKGKAARLNIEQLQAQIAQDLNLGRAVIFEGVHEEPPACELILENRTNYAQKIEKLVFTEKTYDGFFLGKAKLQKFNHPSNATLDACLYYRNDRCVVNKGIFLEKCKNYEIRIGSNGFPEVSQK